MIIYWPFLDSMYKAIKKARLLRLIIESSSDALICEDLDGRVLLWNKAADKIFGYTAKEAVGSSIFLIVPPDKEKETRDALDRLKKGELIREFETVCRRKDGERIYISVTMAPVHDELGKIIGAYVIARDISEQKQLAGQLCDSMKEIEDLYNNAPCGYHSLDKDGVFVRINDTELGWLGYSREEVIGKLKFIDVIDATGIELNRQNFSSFKETGFVKDLQFGLKRNDGTFMPVLLSATAVKDSAGNYLMSRSVVFDLTARKKTEDELRCIYDELVKAQANVKVLSGMLPICGSCKKIRNDHGFWDAIEKYITEHSEAMFTHGLCPDCVRKLYPDFADKILKNYLE